MSALDIFRDDRFPMLVATDSDGAPIFRAADLAKHLSVRDAQNLLRGLPDDEKSQVRWGSLVSTPSDQGEWFVTESGLYRS